MALKSNKVPKGIIFYRIATLALLFCFAAALGLFFWLDDYSRSFGRTQDSQVSITNSITKYYLKTRVFPDSIEALKKSGLAPHMRNNDYWGNPFSIVFPGKTRGACCVRSMGPDGEPALDTEHGFKGDILKCVIERDMKELIALVQES